MICKTNLLTITLQLKVFTKLSFVRHTSKDWANCSSNIL